MRFLSSHVHYSLSLPVSDAVKQFMSLKFFPCLRQLGPVCHLEGWVSSLVRSVCDLWWTKWHFNFPQSESFRHCCTLLSVHNSYQKDERTWPGNLPTKELSFVIPRKLSRKVLLHYSVVQKWNCMLNTDVQTFSGRKISPCT